MGGNKGSDAFKNAVINQPDVKVLEVTTPKGS
jgi:hypothetical protein